MAHAAREEQHYMMFCRMSYESDRNTKQASMDMDLSLQ